MKIRYVHASNPKAEKIFDTEKAYRGCLGLLRDMMTGKLTKTQEQFDKDELDRFDKAVKIGEILSYSVIEESGGMKNDSN